MIKKILLLLFLSSYAFAYYPQSDFILVDKGSSIALENNPASKEYTQLVISKPYYLMVKELTQEQWFNVMGDNPSYFSRKEFCKSTYKVVNNVPMCPQLPVESVNLSDINIFLKKLNSLSKHKYRLPTLAELYYPLIGKIKKSKKPNIKEIKEDVWLKYVNYKTLTKNKDITFSSPKDTSSKFKFLIGNVWEYTSDRLDYNRNMYPSIKIGQSVKTSGLNTAFFGLSFGLDIDKETFFSEANILRQSDRENWASNMLGLRLVRVK